MKHSGSPAKSGGEEKIFKHNGVKSKYKEWDVAYASELVSESLDLGIETLGRSVC